MRNAAEPPRGASPDWLARAADRPVHARLAPPGSKSLTNRALILAALSAHPVVITNPLRARDTLLMAAALRGLGADITEQAGGAQHAPAAGSAPAWQVTPGWASGDVTVDVGNAGTVLRFIPPAATLARGSVRLSGDERASQRPVGPLLAALRELGAAISDGGRGAVPFTVHGSGSISGGPVTLDASGSSQLVSGLLLTAPRFDKGAEIRHEGARVPSAPHIAMTVQMLREAGADVQTGVRPGSQGGGPPGVPDLWRVRPGELQLPDTTVEPDLVNAAPFLAAALVTGGSVTIAGWPQQTLQPASQILEVFTAMGASCSAGPGGLTVTGPGTVRGISADLRDVSEIVPVITAVAAQASSPSALTGIGHMRTHETDRLAALAAEIGAFGGDVTDLGDGLQIRPRPLRGSGAAPGGPVFASHDDHRLVMAAAVLALGVPGGITVANAATVGKTFPGFTTAWAAMLESPS